jgi:hypothetical protein
MELRTYGWELVEVFEEEVAGGYALADAAAERHVRAAVRINVERGHIEIYVARTWGNAHEVLSSEDGNVDSQVLALRVTEALRAHGLAPSPVVESSRLSTTMQSPSPNAAATAPQAIEQVRQTTPRVDASERSQRVSQNANATANGLWLQLAPLLGGSPGGLGMEISGHVGLRAEISPRWALSLMGTVPLRSHAIQAQQGHASVRFQMLGGAGEVTLLRRPFGSAALGLGVTAIVMSLSGSPKPGYIGVNETAFTQAGQAYLRLLGAPHQHFHVFGLVTGGIAVPVASVRFAEQQVASWGAPFVAVGVGCELRAFGW